jgi:hypothetical protein
LLTPSLGGDPEFRAWWKSAGQRGRQPGVRTGDVDDGLRGRCTSSVAPNRFTDTRRASDRQSVLG